MREDLKSDRLNLHRSVLMPAKSPKLNIYADDDLKQNLKTLADCEQRSVSQMADILLKEAVTRLDRLKSEGKI